MRRAAWVDTRGRDGTLRRGRAPGVVLPLRERDPDLRAKRRGGYCPSRSLLPRALERAADAARIFAVIASGLPGTMALGFSHPAVSSGGNWFRQVGIQLATLDFDSTTKRGKSASSNLPASITCQRVPATTTPRGGLSRFSLRAPTRRAVRSATINSGTGSMTWQEVLYLYAYEEIDAHRVHSAGSDQRHAGHFMGEAETIASPTCDSGIRLTGRR